MSPVDITLIHPPSIYDFRKRFINFGLVAQTVRASGVFELLPAGFLSLAHSLREAGYRCRIVNLGALMVRDQAFDVEEYLRGLETRWWGLSLHWLAHAQGMIEIAKLCKRMHPEIPIVVGGITASYYHRELIRYPQVDYILRGDSTEFPLRLLLQCSDGKRSLSGVPNLTWKKNGEVIVNPMTWVPEQLDVQYDVEMLQECDEHPLARDDGDGVTHSSPQPLVSPVPFVRGCSCHCATCGGSNRALGRKTLGLRSASSVIKDIEHGRRLHDDFIPVCGDIRQGDWQSFLELLARTKLGDRLSFELFWPASKDFLDRLTRSVPSFRVTMSPETHDEGIRASIGRGYSNEELEETVERVIGAGGHVLLFFMTGLSRQDHTSVRKTMDYVERLLKRFNDCRHGAVNANLGPLAPTIDPGSPAFENPEAFGYKLRYRSLADHVRAAYTPDWREMLNYESEALDRFSLADVTWECLMRLSEIRESIGLVSDRKAVLTREILTAKRSYEAEVRHFLLPVSHMMGAES